MSSGRKTLMILSITAGMLLLVFTLLCLPFVFGMAIAHTPDPDNPGRLKSVDRSLEFLIALPCSVACLWLAGWLWKNRWYS